MNARKILSIAILAASIFSAGAQQSGKKLLRFRYSKGDKISMVSRVEEDVRINGKRMPHMTILNRISLSIDDTDGRGRGFITANFMTSESFSDYGFFRSVDWDQFSSASEWWRDSAGRFEIADEYFMPIVRDMPIFPEKEVGAGDTWTADGYEAEDFRKNFGVAKPVKVPFTAKYTYLRDEGNLSVIQARYNLVFESPDSGNYFSDPPASTMGYSDVTIWWDNDKGQIDHSEETFRISIETYRGTVYVFSGKSVTEVTEFVKAATDDNVKAVREKVDSLGIRDVSVAKTERGLRIALENIQFEPDSAILVESEKEKIRKIAQIISPFPNDILVSGHTASAGDENSCQMLSEERADAVASYMAEIGVRTRNHIFTEGFGSRRPIGDNSVEEGRQKNRRVELTILDK
ncbi:MULTISPECIES: OmpA family protein [Treponema]|uniref:OmpA/MotB domain protein n=1 Tax=Treponema saccharophilum DSM 2985 TaxID=907348 RepID=H7EH08_9SPIR|nr:MULTISPECIES: OmpA family protein [Treponema]EIC03126.1 OmpA/MotB domain protein [Treponema saccharophilum DSM 2985]MBQ5537258.1 OmpA family protein [Treponema sp.]BDC96566.1 membrane protein [Treponema saccharophilum]